MKKILLLLSILIGLDSLSAQTLIKELRSGFNEVRRMQQGDTLKILAVMVDFQEDKYDATVGTGKFGSIYTQDYGDTIVDPLPHNAEYFSDHLEFAKNYYRKVSGGRVNIAYNVLPQVITVSKYMRDYVPLNSSNDFTPLGNFAKEVWGIADNQFSNVNFSSYNLFIIFHAGVSAGIDLGYFAIDRNLPSIYLSPETFKKIFGSQFNGFPVDNNSAFINNSIIMPETESRESEDVTGVIKLDEFSINGFLVNNIASYLGLPDLFNTETGRSAIGRYGLMDSQGFNAYYGMFPPEPSPWEKMYLGWEQPITAKQEDKIFNIATRLTALQNDTTLLKIPINSSEYFLIENRSQDANKDFLKITYKRSGNIYTKILRPDTLGVYFVAPDSIEGGVVIDVDEFDAATPGNGLVIWHIDENIINQNIADNKINSGDVKGIYVEEADGVLSIGELFIPLPGFEVIDDGSYQDFWYQGNEAYLFKNKFSNDSKPSTKSNRGANSLITLENFSPISNKMSFKAKFGYSNISQVFSAKVSDYALTSVSVPYGSKNSYLVHAPNQTKLIFSNDGSIDLGPGFGSPEIASIYSDGAYFILGSTENKFYWNYCIGVINTAGSIDNNFNVSTPVVISKEGDELYSTVGTEDGTMLKVKLKTLAPLQQVEFSKTKISDEPLSQFCIPFENATGYFAAITKTSFVDAANSNVTLPLEPLKAVITWDRTTNSYRTVILTVENRFVVINKGTVVYQFDVKSEQEISSFSILANNEFGEQYILLSNGNKIEAYNFNGTMVENFPVEEPNGDDFISTPLTDDINGDLITDVIAATSTGTLHVFDGKTGKEISPFPLSIGSSINETPFIYSYTPSQPENASAQQALAVIDKENYLHSWTFGAANDQPKWGSEFAGSTNNSEITVSKINDRVEEFFPVDKAYNWPNPVYDNETNIRYYVDENSQTKVKIFDLAGGLVDELQHRAIGGFDNEIIWNVSKIQSGVYYAHLEVTSDSGKSASKIIKIAVIK